MQEFVRILEQLVELFGQLIPIEEGKLEAAKENQITFVEDCMLKEQALILKLRGLEKERESTQKKLGYEKVSFREILTQLPKEESESLRPLFDELSAQIAVFQEVSMGARRVIQTNLHQIEEAMRQKSGSVYTDEGFPKEEQHFTSRKI